MFTMLENIRTETAAQQFALAADPQTLEPTLVVHGYSTVDVLAAGNAAVRGELIVYTPRSLNGEPLANVSANFTAAWARTYDARPTGFEDWPDTSLLQNSAFWGRAGFEPGFKATKRVAVKVGVGRPKRYTFRFATRRFRYEEYKATDFLQGGSAPGKSYGFMLKLNPERGQLCAVDEKMNTQNFLGNVQTNVIVQVRVFYFYKWVFGNNRPSVYGRFTPATYTLGDTGYVGVPALKAQRLSAFSSATTDFGGADASSRLETVPAHGLSCSYASRESAPVIITNPPSDPVPVDQI